MPPASPTTPRTAASTPTPTRSSDNDDFYEPLRQTFTYEGKQYCVPKDFSTLALQINTDSWEKAGLTDADVPTTWDELEAVSKKLTTKDQAGLGIGVGIDRLGAFVVQNGGWWLKDDGSGPVGEHPGGDRGPGVGAEERQGRQLQDVQRARLRLGRRGVRHRKSAMTIEGNWIAGAVKNDYPDLKYKTVELPAGPKGKGTLQFTQCWGVAADSKAQAQAVDLVKALSTVDQQMAFADAFGVMPSRQSAAEQYKAKFPEDAPFIAGGEYGHGPINAAGMEQVVADLNSKLEGFGGANIPQVLEGFDTNASAALGEVSTADAAAEPGTGRAPRRRRRGRARASGSRWPGGCSSRPTLVVLGLFLVIPIVMALWVSFSDWNGRGSPFSSRVEPRRRAELRGPAHRAGAVAPGLHDLAAQHLLLRHRRRAAADGRSR